MPPRNLPTGISRRSDGSYRVRRAGWRERRATSYEAAERHRREMYADDLRLAAENRAVRFGAFLTDWLDARGEADHPHHIAGSTERSYRMLARTYLKPHPIWHTPLAKISGPMVRDALTGLTDRNDQPLAAGTVALVRNLVSTTLGAAVLAGIIRDNPARGIRTAPIRRAKIVPLDATELGMLLHHLQLTGDRLTALYAISIQTGMRQGEALGLRWADVGDLDQQRVTIIISGQLVKHTRQREDRTKTVGSVRSVKVTGAARMALIQWRQTQAAELAALSPGERRRRDPDGLVFTAGGSASGKRSQLGMPIRANSLAAHLQRVLLASKAGPHRLERVPGAPPVRWHDLRHAYATVMLSGKIGTLDDVMYSLGHKSIRTTIDIYGHLTDHTRDRLADGIDAAIGVDHPLPEQKGIAR